MMPGPQMLRQVVVQHGSVLAILAVPKAHALAWLRGSGCGGLYLRPFWTGSTDPALGREKFSLLWLRGQAERGPELWGMFHDKEGVVGLLLAGKDVALRVDQTANVRELEAKLGIMLKNQEERFHQAVKGQRWWRLGPMTEAESWQALEMVRETGLEPIRGELKWARMGRWRHAVFFAAVGQPSRMTLDDGSRGSTEAFLMEAPPPPKTAGKTATPGAKGEGTAALAESSAWAGPRRASPEQSAAVGTAAPRADPHQVEARRAPVVGQTEPPRQVSLLPRQQQRPAWVPEDQGADRLATTGSVDAATRKLIEGLQAMIEDLRMEIRTLRRENELMRQAQVRDSMWGGVPSGAGVPLGVTSLLPLPTAAFSPVRPVPMEKDEERLRGREPGSTPDAKRLPGVARNLEECLPNV